MLSAGFPEAQAIIVFSTPENQSTQQLRLRRTGPHPDPLRACKNLTNSRQSHLRFGAAGDPVNSIE